MKNFMLKQMVAVTLVSTAGFVSFATEALPTDVTTPATNASVMESKAVAKTPAESVAEALENAIWPTEKTTVDPSALTGGTTATIDAIMKANGEAKVSGEMSVGNVPAQYVSHLTEEALAPYLGKRIVSISISPVAAETQAMIAKNLFSRSGDSLTKETVENDIVVIGNMGVFSEVTPVFQSVPEGVQVTYVVTPNPVVKSVEVMGNTIYSTKQLQEYLAVPVGKVLNTVKVGARLQGVTAAYARDGYMLAGVSGIEVSPTGEVRITISEGIVEKIETKGNTKTKKRVITREMIQKENMPFNKFMARRSVQNIYNTGYFEDVNIRLLPGSTPDRVVIEVDVAEQRTGTVTVGAGYSESNGFVGLLELGENNFRGLGDKVNLHWEFGGKGSNGKNYTVSYTRPWLDDKGTSGSISLFNRQDEYTDYQADGSSFSQYDRKTSGATLAFGRQSGVFSREYVTLDMRNDKWVHAIGGADYSTSPKYIADNFGKTNSITYQRVFDSRDNVYDPSAGKRFTYSLQYAGLGGDFSFEKLTAELRTYKKIGNSQVLALRLAAGIGLGNIPYSQLYTVGGSDSLRGYEDAQFRGRKYYNATLEYRFPIFKKVQGVVFADVGSAWDAPNVPWHTNGSKFNLGVGPGLRIQTPIGPVRIDYGWGKEGGKFSFAFGGQF